MDDFDRATEREMMDRELCIANARRVQPVLASGVCHNCGEKVQGEFCDADCREDWEKRRRVQVGFEKSANGILRELEKSAS